MCSLSNSAFKVTNFLVAKSDVSMPVACSNSSLSMEEK